MYLEVFGYVWFLSYQPFINEQLVDLYYVVHLIFAVLIPLVVVFFKCLPAHTILRDFINKCILQNYCEHSNVLNSL